MPIDINFNLPSLLYFLMIKKNCDKVKFIHYLLSY